jgi:2-keto-4-pentenoate hydratase/2-oxohepta-3-ene-1,7-dioic acid hydratase in catechol pathway
MKIARFLDTKGTIHLGTPIDAGHARRLGGHLYNGLTETDDTFAVARWLAPIIPVNVYGIGLNYRAHAEETGAAIPAQPVIFMKPTTAITDPGNPIILPAACEHGPEVDYEAELAVVIGRTARDVPVESALDHVLGYTCANDVLRAAAGRRKAVPDSGSAARASTDSVPWVRSWSRPMRSLIHRH